MGTVRWSDIRDEHTEAVGHEDVERCTSRLTSQVRAHGSDMRERRSLSQCKPRSQLNGLPPTYGIWSCGSRMTRAVTFSGDGRLYGRRARPGDRSCQDLTRSVLNPDSILYERSRPGQHSPSIPASHRPKNSATKTTH
jgi:hypothetical protein